MHASLLAAITKNENLPEEMKSSAQTLLNLSPTERIIQSLEMAGIKEQVSAIPFYNYYIERVGMSSIRNEYQK